MAAAEMVACLVAPLVVEGWVEAPAEAVKMETVVEVAMEEAPTVEATSVEVPTVAEDVQAAVVTAGVAQEVAV